MKIVQIVSFALTIALLQQIVSANLIGGGVKKNKPSVVEKLCTNKTIELNNVDDFHKLADRVQNLQFENDRFRNQLKCPEPIVSATSELYELTKAVASGENACTIERAQKFRDFFSRTCGGNNNKYALRDFVIAYGLQFSRICRASMLDVIKSNGDEWLAPDALERLHNWADDKGPLKELMSDMKHPGDIILPGDIIALMKQSNAASVPERLYIQTVASGKIRDIKDVCENHFEPFYRPVIMPSAILGGAGFNYANRKLAHELKHKVNKKKVKRWTKIVFVCEMMKMVEPVEYLPDEEDDETNDPNQQAKGVDKKRQLRILTEEEANEIKEKLRVAAANNGASSSQWKGVDKREDYQLKKRVKIDNEVYNKGFFKDWDLKSDINGFRYYRRIFYESRGNLLRKSVKIFINIHEKSHLRFWFSRGARRMRSGVRKEHSELAIPNGILEPLNALVETKYKEEKKTMLDWFLGDGSWSSIATRFVIYTILIAIIMFFVGLVG